MHIVVVNIVIDAEIALFVMAFDNLLTYIVDGSEQDRAQVIECHW